MHWQIPREVFCLVKGAEVIKSQVLIVFVVLKYKKEIFFDVKFLKDNLRRKCS